MQTAAEIGDASATQSASAHLCFLAMATRSHQPGA